MKCSKQWFVHHSKIIITSVEGCTNKIGDSNFRRQLLLLCKIRSTMSTRKQLFLLHRNSIWLYNRYFLFFKRSTIVNIRGYKSSQILVWTLLRTFFYNVRIPWSPNKLVLLPYKKIMSYCVLDITFYGSCPTIYCV